MSSDRELVVFVVGGQRCAVDLAAAERVEPMVAVTRLTGAPAGVVGAIDVHGSVLPVLDIRARLGMAAAEPRPDASLLLARTASRRVALVVDEVLGHHVVDAAAVASAEPLGLPSPVTGVVALPDGLLFVHDLDGFLSEEAQRRLAPALANALR